MSQVEQLVYAQGCDIPAARVGRRFP